MAVFKIECDIQSEGFLKERQFVSESVVFDDECLPWLIKCAEKAVSIPNGYIKKIVWDAEGGFPEHSHGTIQYSPRPYVQGYGCDGTTDENIHLIASSLCAKLGIDYVNAYTQAYGPDRDIIGWIRELSSNPSLLEETVAPENAGTDELTLMLQDLYAINNRALVCVLEDIFEERGITVDWA